jgi:hypothetical protein
MTRRRSPWRLPPSWLGVNTIYTSHGDVAAKARTEHSRSTTPFFLIEARYENEGFDGTTMRQQAYKGYSGAAAARSWGNKPIWLLHGLRSASSAARMPPQWLSADAL